MDMSEDEKKEFKGLVNYLIHDLNSSTMLISYWTKALKTTELTEEQQKCVKVILAANQKTKDIEDYFYTKVKEREMI